MTDLRPIDVASIAAPAHVAPGAAPMLQWIEIAQLVVDDTYQRAPHQKVVQAIADAFDWRKFSTVVVAPIEGGSFAIIDGQHRCHAAAACGIEKVPCQVTIMDRAEQAKAFAAINTVATRVHPISIFKAAIAAGDAWAIEVRDVCAMAGCRAMTWPAHLGRRSPGDILAVGFLRKAIADHGSERIETALGILRQADELGENLEAYNIGLLQPIIGAIATRPHVLKSPDAGSVALDRIGVMGLRDEATALRMQRLRAGLPAMGLKDLLESTIGDALDKAVRGGGV